MFLGLAGNIAEQLRRFRTIQIDPKDWTAICGHGGSTYRSPAMTHLKAKGRDIMMHPHSPSSRQLAVPGIGFPLNISAGANVPDEAAFRGRPRASCVRKIPRPTANIMHSSRDPQVRSTPTKSNS